jgi:precorrin-6A/cobalt-precorrin-6A reductase
MNTVLLIGGTTESRHAAGHLQDEGYRVVTSVATGLGELYAAGNDVMRGRKGADALATEARRMEACALVDSTHPFAVDVSSTARRAAAAAGIPYLRYCRAESEQGPGVATAASFPEAVDIIQLRDDRALLTIGVRHLELFTDAGIDFTARVLPLPKSIDECRRAGMDPEDIIAAFPPFDTHFNRACIRKSGARVIVMKDSGSEGGTPDKIAAAREEGIDALVVARPDEQDVIHDIETLVTRLEEALSS